MAWEAVSSESSEDAEEGDVKVMRGERASKEKGFLLPALTRPASDNSLLILLWLSEWCGEQWPETDDAYIPKRETESEKTYKGRQWEIER